MATWFITGASRGIGAAIMQAVHDKGDNIIATGRNVEKIRNHFNASDRLLAVEVDVTNTKQINDAVEAGIKKFGTIDILVNNAGYGYLGMFEETTTEEIRAEFDTNVFGLMEVTRAIIPILREKQKGHIFNISSIAGLKGTLGGSIYNSSKFAVEGFSQSIAEELAPFGISVTCISPGFFRTDFLDTYSVKYPKRSINDYDLIMKDYLHFLEERNHHQLGDPKMLAQVILQLTKEDKPPVSFVAGSDAVAWATSTVLEKQRELHQWQALSISTDGRWEG